MKVHRTRAALAVGGLLATTAGGALIAATPFAGTAGATPPPAAQAPIELFHEDFENGLADGELVTLNNYVGHQGQTYGSEPNWNNPAACNGFVLDGNTTDATLAGTGCPDGGSYVRLRAMATSLGSTNGTATPADNHAVVAYTANPSSANNAIELRTNAPLPITVQNRFLTFSVNVAVVNCFSNHPKLNFFLDDAGTELPVTTTPIDPCPDGSRSISSDGSVLFTGSELGIVMRNVTGTSAGNDHAFDDIRLFDATPQLSKDFPDTGVVAGQPSTLTFTATNTTELAAKDGWTFTDNLPAGMTVAPNPNVGGTCAGDTAVTAPAGAAAISVVGDLTSGQASCTITVDVVPRFGGTYTNGSANITSTGIDLVGDETVTVSGPSAPPGGPGACTEDGLQVLEPPVSNIPVRHDSSINVNANGLASGTVHSSVEPLVGGLGLGVVEALVHQVNCEVVVPVEDVVDAITIPVVEQAKVAVRNLLVGLHLW